MTGGAAAMRGIGLYLAAVQLLFALGWIVYVVFLPQLAQQAGLPARWLPWLLAADQLVFVLTDLAVGLASDRAARVLGRIGRWVVAASLVSALAFLALPWVAPQGSPLLFGAVTGVWVLTSAALRAPPLTLLGRYVARPAQPAMVAFNAFGLGLANALAPYLGLQLKAADPRLPFVLSALGLAALTLGMVAAERALARRSGAAAEAGARPAPPAQRWAFVAACACGALAFQWHASVSSAALWLRHVGAGDLPWVLPLFWVGFNLALLPAGALARRLGAAAAMAIGAELAMLATAGAAFAPGPAWLGAAQLAAGAGWALLLCAAFSDALALGHSGREGLMSGALTGTLAAAALARITVMAAAAPPPAQVIGLAWGPAIAFALCAALLVARAVTQR